MKDHLYRNLVLAVALVVVGGAIWFSVGVTRRHRSNLLTPEARPVEYVKPAARPGATPLSVTFKSPSGADFSPQGSPTIVATFSQAMVPLGEVTEETILHALKLDPPEPGRYRWIGTRTITFMPDHLPPATTFTVSIPSGLVSQAGGVLADGVSWKFSTTGPDLLDSWPANAASEVEPSTVVFLHFNQPMAADAVQRDLAFTRADQAVPCHVRSATAADLARLQTDPGWSEKDPQTIVVVTPDQPLPRASHFELRLAKGLRAQTGDVATHSDIKLGWSTWSPLKLEEVAADQYMDIDSSVDFRFNNNVNGGELRRHLHLTPKPTTPPPPDDDESQDVYERLGWQPNTHYHYSIDADLQDVHGQKLGHTVTGQFTTGHRHPTVDAKSGLWSLEAHLPHAMAVGAINVDSLQVGMKAVPSQDVVPLLNTLSRYDPPQHLPLHPWPVGSHDDVETWKNLDLTPVMGGRQHGLVEVQIRDLTEHDQVETTVIQVTDLAVNLKSSAENTVVWVTSLSAGTPTAGAHVELRNPSGKVVWTGTTDASGLAVAPGWHDLGIPIQEYNVAMMTALASVGDDMVVTQSGSTPTYDFDINSNPRAAYPTSECFLFSERGLYRAGETVHYKGIYREIRHGQWVVAPNVPVKLVINNARDQAFKTLSTKTDAYGSFDCSFDLPAKAPSGDWSLTATPANAPDFRNDFQVQAYRPVTFETQVDAGQPAYEQSSKLQARVDSHYLFGAPVNHAPVSWTVTMSPGGDDFAAWDGWWFGPSPELNGGLWGRGGDQETVESTLAKGSTQLSADGHMVIDAALSDPSIGSADHLLAIEATVEAPDHRQVTGRATVPLFAGQFTLGLKPQTDFLDAGTQPQGLQVVAVDHNGKAVGGHQVHVNLVRRQWDSIRHDGSWDVAIHDTPVSGQDLTTASGPHPTQVSFKVDQAGWYFLEASAQDAAGHKVESSTTFWAFGGGYVAWSRDGADKITLVPDKKRYKPGDTAHVMIQNPYPSAWALVTLERELILDHHVVQVHGSAPVIDIPIDQKDLPNVYVSVVLVQGRTRPPAWDSDGNDVGQPSYKLGYVNLPVDAESRRLRVTVAPDHPTYHPGDTVKVALNLQDASGHGVAGCITLSAVDLGVLNLINYHTPDAYADFYGPRELGVENAESRQYLLGGHKPGEKGGGGGPDAAGELNVRKNFKMTAYWNPCIETDANGHADISFQLPDNLSTFRLMAVAQTADCFGSAEKAFVVTTPLVLTGSMPRFVTVGDVFQAGVTATNRTDDQQTVKVHCQANGIDLTGEADQSVALPPNGTAMVMFDFKAPDPDAAGGEQPAATLVFNGQMGSASDALELHVPVQTPRFLEAAATSSNTETSTLETLQAPTGVWPGTSRVEVNLSSTALGPLRNALDDLVHYPYGCLEQKVSRLYPMLLGASLAPQFGIKGFDEASAKAYIQDFIDDFHTYQTSSGGCTLWGNPEDDECPFASVYAYNFLVEARAAGYAVPKPQMDLLEGYVNTLQSQDQSDWKWPYSEADRLMTQSLGVMAMARDNDVDSDIERLYDEHAKLPLVAQTWLARAMVRSGHFKPQLAKLVEHFQQGVQLDPAQGYIDLQGADAGDEWAYDSHVRTTACVLSALLEAGQTEHTPDIMTWLLGHSHGGAWGTTQENAWALEAALAYLHRMEAVPPDFTAQVQLQGHKVAEAQFKGRTTTVEHRLVPLEAADAGQRLPMAIGKTGAGRLYYTLRLFYSPQRPADWAQDQGLAIDKVLEDLDGHEVTTAQAGHIYQVTLTIVAPRERSFVAVNDPIPAGFEVVNTDFDTESKVLASMLDRTRSEQDRWGTFNHWEIYDDRVELFADNLEDGAHRFTYLVRAIYPGTYWQGPSRAEAMYEPDIFGSTMAEPVTIQP